MLMVVSWKYVVVGGWVGAENETDKQNDRDKHAGPGRASRRNSCQSNYNSTIRCRLLAIATDLLAPSSNESSDDTAGYMRFCLLASCSMAASKSELKMAP